MLTHLTRIRTIGAILPFAFIALTAFPALKAHAAPSRCGSHASIVDTLKKKYGETAHSIGLVSDQGVMQVFVSEANGTWTILMTNPQGQACLLAAGKGWEQLKQQASGENA